MTIELLTIDGDQNNDLAREALRKLGARKDVTIKEAVCSPGVRELYEMPLITVEPGHRFFGVERIQHFVSSQLKLAHT